MTDIFGDGLSVGDGQEAVLLVRSLQDLCCRLSGGGGGGSGGGVTKNTSVIVM